MSGSYYCKLCLSWHLFSSKIGRAHLPFVGPPPGSSSAGKPVA